MSKFEVIIEEPAYMDLQGIFDYIAEDSPLIAEQVLDDLMMLVDTLGEFPKKHMVILSTGGMEIRQLIFKKGFRVLYTIQENSVHILHCFRCEQDFPEKIFK